MEDSNGKEILLQYVTVKVPGKTPKGSKPTSSHGEYFLLNYTFLNQE